MVPVAEGGTDEDENFLTLCYRHHGVIHKTVRRDTRELQRKALAAIDPAVRAEQKARSAATMRRKAAANREIADRHFRETVMPDLRGTFLRWPPTLVASVDHLNRAGVFRPCGRRWTIESFRDGAARIGFRVRAPRRPFTAWVNEHRWMAEQIIAAGCRTYGKAAEQVRAFGIPHPEDKQWTPVNTRRFFRAAGCLCPGTGRKNQSPNDYAKIELRTESHDIQATYMSDWRNFCRWRGSEIAPVPTSDVCRYMVERFSSCGWSRSRKIMGALGHVHYSLGHDRLTMRPEVRKLMRERAIALGVITDRPTFTARCV